ncbi:MAG: ABC transporter substrate-binding protein [Gammaproteobacteria bacterium]|nr:ABC transporter substrate-binding protein [Gammaproteobacteria bacterium]
MIRSILMLSFISLALSGCDSSAWNNPHPKTAPDKLTMYSVFSNKPKHLDPVRTYNLDEATLIDQIYEPLLEYHYLKRPYQLQPLTLIKMPTVSYLDQQGQILKPASNGDVSEPAYSVYSFELKKGIYYQPHPAFANNEQNQAYYRVGNKTQYQDFQNLDQFSQIDTKELIADDYIYQIKRMADPTLHLPIWDLLSQYIVGLKPLRQQIKSIRTDNNKQQWIDLSQLDLTGVTKNNDYSFSIKLKGKYPQFKYWLAFHFFAPIPVEVDRFYHLPGLADKNISLDFYPVGTGPYMMTKHNPNQEIVLSRNPNYHDDFYPSSGSDDDQAQGLLVDAGKKLPFIDQVSFRLEKESIPIWTKFLQGYYDRSGISSDSFDQAVNVGVEGIGLSDDMRKKGISLTMAISPATYYFGFNMLDPIVGGNSEKNRKLRRAIAMVYNEQEQISIFRNGRGQVAQDPLPPGIFGAYKGGEQGINPYIFDWDSTQQQPVTKSLAQAQEMLAQAGYPQGRDSVTGKPLILNYDTTGSNNASQNWMIKQFKKLGIQLNIRSTDYNRFQEKMELGNAQIFSWGWFADYPDPENFLFLLYGPNGRVGSGGSGVNASNYDNPQYNRLFNQMKTMADSPERLAIIKQMIDIYHRDLPWASGFHPQSFVLNNQWMKNYKPHGISQATLKFQNIDPQLREQKRQQWNQPVLWPLALVLLVVLLVTIPGVLAYRRRQTMVLTDNE